MFTGLVEGLGTVEATLETSVGRRVRIGLPAGSEGDLPIGASVALNGICQTVMARPTEASIEVVAVPETLRRTTLGDWAPGRRVNVERPLRVGDRLGGHWVQGHVDGVGRIAELGGDGADAAVRVELPAELGRYVVEKGSIAVDGVSLTVGRTVGPPAGPTADEPPSFWVHVIPETRARTSFGHYRAGDRVNLEVDILAKYVERLVGPRSTGGGAR